MPETLALRQCSAASQPPAPDQQTASALPPLLLDTRDMCGALRISSATLFRLKSAGRLPRARNLGGLKWDADEVKRWVSAGMPPLKEWEAVEAANKRNGRPS
jgi:predicted DNA-binding transcriptional regulator AlpA